MFYILILILLVFTVLIDPKRIVGIFVGVGGMILLVIIIRMIGDAPSF